MSNFEGRWTVCRCVTLSYKKCMSLHKNYVTKRREGSKKIRFLSDIIYERTLFQGKATPKVKFYHNLELN